MSAAVRRLRRSHAAALATLLLIAPAAVLTAAPMNFGKVTRETLSNGLPVVVVERHDAALVDMLLVVRGGAASDPAGKSGLTSLTVESLRRGAGARNALQLAGALDSLGANLTTLTGAESARLELNLLSKDASAGLDLLADLVLRPRFELPEIQKEKTQTLARLEQEKDDPDAVADRHILAALYGKHPYGRPASGTVKSVTGITLADVVKHHGATFVPENCFLIVVGDVVTADLLRAVSARFGAWPKKAAPKIEISPPSAPSGRRILILDREDSTQSQVRLATVGLARPDPRWDTLFLCNTVLGSGFTSRLTERLRIDLSLTYGASSQMPQRSQPGPIIVSTFTPTETTRKIVDEALAILKSYRETGPTPEELEKAKGFRSGLLAISLQSYDDVASELANALLYGLPPDHISGAIDRWKAVTLEKAKQDVAIYPGDAWTLVIDGKASEVRPQMEGLGEITVV
ncbi:MAG TPA: pitrilysin family protein, partial [Thermoanaerobaculia bacterium]